MSACVVTVALTDRRSCHWLSFDSLPLMAKASRDTRKCATRLVEIAMDPYGQITPHSELACWAYVLQT